MTVAAACFRVVKSLYPDLDHATVTQTHHVQAIYDVLAVYAHTVCTINQ